MVELESLLISIASLGEISLVWVLSKRSLEVIFSWRSLLSDVHFFKEKGHSLSVAPEPLAILNKKLEDLGSLSLEKLKISSEDMYPAAPEYISGFFCSRETQIEGLLSCSQVACFLLEVGGRWWLSCMLHSHGLHSVAIFFQIYYPRVLCLHTQLLFLYYFLSLF
jgi:hypothetical protein